MIHQLTRESSASEMSTTLVAPLEAVISSAGDVGIASVSCWSTIVGIAIKS
jgi:hypothetical protein